MIKLPPPFPADPNRWNTPKSLGFDAHSLHTTPWEHIGGVTLMIVRSDLDDLLVCHDMLESTMASELATFQRRADAQASTLSEFERGEFYRFHSGSYWMLDEVFPSIVRSSMFLTCYSLLESRLDQFCRQAGQEMGTHLTLQDMRGKGIVRAQRFLKKAVRLQFPDDMKQWQDILTYSIIRNALVHANGVVGDDKKRTRLRQFADKTRGLVKLRLAEHIELQAGFVPHVITTIGEFFERLHSAWQSVERHRPATCASGKG
jgi:hypothetical protein